MNKKKLIILISIIITLALLVCVGVFAISGSKKAKIEDKLDLGEKYLEELKYEKALAAYKEVLKIDPKSVEAYLGMAEVYIAMGEYEEALEILEEGYEETESRKLEKKIEEVEALMSGGTGAGDGDIESPSMYFICIDGVQFNLPFKLSELEKVGFDLTECKGTQIEAGENTHYWLVKNNLNYSFHIRNQNETASDVLDCVVTDMALDVVDCSKGGMKTIGDIEYGSDEALVIKVSEQYGGSVTETEDGRLIYRFPENGTGQYRIDVGSEGFANYFEVCCWDTSVLYSVDMVDRFAEGGATSEPVATPKPTEAPAATPQPTATPEPEQAEPSDDFVIDWIDPNLEARMRDVTGIYDRDIVYGDVKDITELNFSMYYFEDGAKITDISALGYLTNLNYLFLSDNAISDISAVGKLTKLASLSLDNNPISDLSALGNLKELTLLSMCGVAANDMSVLGELTNLGTLDLSQNSLTDISFLSNLIYLWDLRLRENMITDISPLSGLTDLYNLDLGENEISDVTPLSNLTGLMYLYLDYNPLSDISALSSLVNLDAYTLYGTQVTDFSAVSHAQEWN